MVNLKSTPSECCYCIKNTIWTSKWFLWRCLWLCLYQGLHEQPGVESQRVLSAHHLLQPITDRVNHLKIAPSSRRKTRDFCEMIMIMWRSETEGHLYECWSFSVYLMIICRLSVHYYARFLYIVTNTFVNVVKNKRIKKTYISSSKCDPKKWI